MNKLIKLMGKAEENILLKSVRRGMMMMLPIVIIASISQAIIAFPVSGFRNWIENVCGGGIYDIFFNIKSFSFSYFSVILTLSTSLSYAMEKREHGENLVITPILSEAAFLLIVNTSSNGAFDRMGVQSCFIAIAVGLSVSSFYLYLFHLRRSKLWKNIGGNDIIYSGVMRAIIPCLIVMLSASLFSFLLRAIFGIDDIILWLSHNFETFMEHIKSGFGTTIAATAFIHILWFFGIHGNNVFENFMSAHSAVGDGIVFSKTFFDTFINMGGCGTSVCVKLAIIFAAKQKRTRRFAKSAFATIIFNINEILTFGLPIILNPAMLIPFILVPIECALIAYPAISLGLVAPVTTNVDWTVPALVSGYMATGGSISGSLLQLVNIIVGTLTYIPFIRLNERMHAYNVHTNISEITRIFKNAEKSGIQPDFLSSTNTIGAVAHMLIEDLKTAVENNELYLLYQPQFISDGTCIGAEALIRWRHPLAGYIYPPLVIYLAQQGGFLSELEKLIFDRACAAIKEVDSRSTRKFKISVNITTKSLAWNGLDTYISTCVSKYGIHPEKLWIEITEQDILSREQNIIDKIRGLKEKGHSFLIDDFGMGKTSILYLQTNLFDGIKLDGSLITTILGNRTNCEIVSSIIGLGEKLGIKVIAEYVETSKHRELLSSLGCDWYQGYYFSRPVSLDEFIERLNSKTIKADEETATI